MRVRRTGYDRSAVGRIACRHQLCVFAQGSDITSLKEARFGDCLTGTCLEVFLQPAGYLFGFDSDMGSSRNQPENRISAL